MNTAYDKAFAELTEQRLLIKVKFLGKMVWQPNPLTLSNSLRYAMKWLSYQQTAHWDIETNNTIGIVESDMLCCVDSATWYWAYYYGLITEKADPNVKFALTNSGKVLVRIIHA